MDKGRGTSRSAARQGLALAPFRVVDVDVDIRFSVNCPRLGGLEEEFKLGSIAIDVLEGWIWQSNEELVVEGDLLVHNVPWETKRKSGVEVRRPPLNGRRREQFLKILRRFALLLMAVIGVRAREGVRAVVGFKRMVVHVEVRVRIVVIIVNLNF
jgi:hypothetical protein